MFDLFNFAAQEEKETVKKEAQITETVEKTATTEEAQVTEAVETPVTTNETNDSEVVVTEAPTTTNEVVVTSADGQIEKETPEIDHKKATPTATSTPDKKETFEVNTAAIVRYCGESFPITDFFGTEEIQEGLTAEKVRKRLEADYPELVSSHTEVLSIKKKNQIYIVPTLKAKKKGCTAEVPQSIPFAILIHFERIAKQYAQKKLEVHADIYYCFERKQFLLDVPKQDVSTLNCEVTEDMASIYDRIGFDIKKVAEIHSHHFMAAVPSSTDDKAERVPGMNYFIIGEMQKVTPTLFGRRFISDDAGWELLDIEAIFTKEGAK